MSTNVLVTGGSGFIGSWVLHELIRRGMTPVVVDVHPAPQRWERILGSSVNRVQWGDASLLDRDSLRNVIERNGVTHIIHLAALLTPACQQDPWLGCQVNVLGSMAVFEAARLSKQISAVSYASSFAVYGPEVGDDQSQPNRPPMFYGAFKQSVDLIVEQYWRHFGIPSVAVRPHVVYGPERDQGLTAGPSLATRAAVLGQRYVIGYTGQVGYDYVEDVARAFVRSALECPARASVVDLPGEQATTQDFVQAIYRIVPEAEGTIEVSGAEIPSSIPPHPNGISNLFPDWKPTSLIDGVRQTVEFYRRSSQPQ